MSLESQSVCLLCGGRELFLAAPDRSPGDRTRSRCPDCGFIAARVVTVVYDPDLYGLVDPYGAGDTEQRYSAEGLSIA